MSMNITIIDCDFFNHITETSKDTKYFEDLIRDLKIVPVMHEYVYFQEMILNKCAEKLVNDGLLKIEKFEEFINDENEEEYVRFFESFYRYANGKNIQYIKNDYKTYRKSRENLGEIHSICLAIIKKYPMLLSDDSGAKRLNNIVEKKSQIVIKNIYDVYSDIAIMKNKFSTRESFENVMRFYGVKKEEVKSIKKKWIGD